MVHLGAKKKKKKIGIFEFLQHKQDSSGLTQRISVSDTLRSDIQIAFDIGLFLLHSQNRTGKILFHSTAFHHIFVFFLPVCHAVYKH